MILSAALVLLAFGGWTSATFKQKCSKGCSNDVGYDCGWANVACSWRRVRETCLTGRRPMPRAQGRAVRAVEPLPLRPMLRL
jgi:hypothetical protein